MSRKWIIVAALALVAGAAILFVAQVEREGRGVAGRRGFVRTSGPRFVVDGRPFRFVGANVAVMYRDEDRARMPETLRQAALDGVRVVRVWASGEGGPNDIGPVGGDRNDWPRTHPFRPTPDEWNEEAFVHLDRVLAEAARHNLRVQLTLVNWWRDTGGVTQYLYWAGIKDAADTRYPYGINLERAMLFYTNEGARRLYRQHVERIVTRRNSVTGVPYRDDPTIMGYELMNEAQAIPGRWAERRAWVAEMSAYVRLLDPNHLITPGTWGYRMAVERRAWLEEHRLPTVDYCDAHHYPRDDRDTSVDSPDDLRWFIDNRAAAAFSLRKPLVFGEFGMAPEGFKGFSRETWFRSYFESAAHAGVGGAMFWILTPDPHRGYGIAYTGPRDQSVREEIARAARLFASLQNEPPPRRLLDAGHHLVPHQFAFTRRPDDPATRPEIKIHDDGTLLYRFNPETAVSARFEKLGGGAGYIWGAGVGEFDYVVPARDKWGQVGSLVVRAHIQPVIDDPRQIIKQTRVTLLIDGTDCGSRLIPVEDPKNALTQEWRVDSLAVRLRAALGRALSIRFAVKVTSDDPFGANISGYPEGYDAHGATPIEIEVR